MPKKLKVGRDALVMRIRRFFGRDGLNFRRARSAAECAEYGSWYVVDGEGHVIHSAGPGVEESLADLALRLARVQEDAGVEPRKRLVYPWEQGEVG